MSNPYQVSIRSKTVLNKLKYLKRRDFITKRSEDVGSVYERKLARLIARLGPRAESSYKGSQDLAFAIAALLIDEGDALDSQLNQDFTQSAFFASQKTRDMFKAVLPASYFEHLAGGLLLEAERGDPQSRTLAKIQNRKMLTKFEKRIVDESVLPPPSAGDVQRVLTQEVNGSTWEERLQGHSKLLANPDRLLSEIGKLTEEGVPHTDWFKTLAPLVQGNVSAAKRIANTESQRIMNEITNEAYDRLGDLIIGFQYEAILDDVTRPAHAALNSTVFFKNPNRTPNLSDLAPVNPPWAPNCRCYLSQVLADEEVVRTQAGNLAIKTPEGDILDPGNVNDWFARQPEDFRRRVVGKNRYNLMKQQLGREPDWASFVDPQSGQLLKMADLKKESAVDASRRVGEVLDQINNFKTIVKTVMKEDNVIEDPDLIPRFISQLQKVEQTPLPFRQNMGTSKARVVFDSTEPLDNLSDMLGKSITAEDIATLAGASDGATVTFSQEGNILTIKAEHPGYTITRTIDLSQTEGFTIVNQEMFFTKANQELAPLVLARQVQQAQKLGFTNMTAQADATLAKIGYNLDFPIISGKKVSDSFEFPYNTANNLQELLAIEGGAEFWEKNGADFQGVFGLERNSESIKMLNFYVAEKLDKGEGVERLEESLANPGGENSSFARNDPDLDIAFEKWRQDFIKRKQLQPDGTNPQVEPELI
jgi:SPP1 gp7 family putative phage head morphogenesis protein